MSKATQMPPGYFASLSDEAKLALLEEAAFKLATGQDRVEVRHGEYWTRYGLGSITYLQREITRLRAIVGRRQGFVVTPPTLPMTTCTTKIRRY